MLQPLLVRVLLFQLFLVQLVDELVLLDVVVHEYELALLQLLRDLGQLTAADILSQRVTGLFLEHSLQVPLGVT